MELKNLVVLITGGASGIGEAIALYLYNKESDVYICDLDSNKGSELEKATNGKIKFIRCDVTSEENVEEMINKIRKEKGRLDCLINCAGIGGFDYTATKDSVFSSKIFKKVMNINSFGTFNVSRFASKLMIDNVDNSKLCNGIIINISSIAGTDGPKSNVAYSASKGSVDGMTLPMARDLGKYKIRVNTIAPGPIYTPMMMSESLINKEKFENVEKMLKQATPLKRLGTTLDVVSVAEFLIKNTFINGTIIRIDGGIRGTHF